MLKKDEFHSSLSYSVLHDKYIRKQGYSIHMLNETLIRQRNIAHMLSEGYRVRDIPPDVISRAKI